VYPIRKVDRLQAEDIEYLGTKRKFWFTLDGRRYLFKAEERGTGEDWAEKIVCELARELGIPHVEYDLAHEYEGSASIQPGVICPTFVPRPGSLILGNQLLFAVDPDYPSDEARKYGGREYTVDAVAQVVSLLLPPSLEWMRGAPSSILCPMGVFTGYVLLDAWVANQDRHHQNWGAVLHARELSLAPTFDHGASLARNLTDEERKERLFTKDRNRTVEHFAARARSAFFERSTDRKTMRALDVFRRFAERDPVSAGIWLGKLAEIDDNRIDAILEQVPPRRMSPVTREFTRKLLMINQTRLLEVLP